LEGRVEEKKKADPGEGLLQEEKVGEAEGSEGDEKERKIEIVDLVLFEKPSSDPFEPESHGKGSYWIESGVDKGIVLEPIRLLR